MEEKYHNMNFSISLFLLLLSNTLKHITGKLKKKEVLRYDLYRGEKL